MFGVGVGIRVGGFTPSGGVAPYVGLLDDYPGAAAAYSVRLLKSTYTGSAIRVRRSSDNTEQDIGFTALGNLDTSALTSFCGAGNGFVTTWYDQSGNGYNATQTTAANQPQIVSSGSVLNVNTKPALSFDGSNDYLINSSINISQPNTDITTSTLNSSGCVIFDGTVSRQFIYGDSSLGFRFYAENIGVQNLPFSTSQSLHYAIANFSNAYYYRNNTLVSSGDAGSNNLTSLVIGISANLINAPLNGSVQELILYSSNQSSNRTGISSNINTYYAIY